MQRLRQPVRYIHLYKQIWGRVASWAEGAILLLEYLNGTVNTNIIYHLQTFNMFLQCYSYSSLNLSSMSLVSAVQSIITCFIPFYIFWLNFSTLLSSFSILD